LTGQLSLGPGLGYLSWSRLRRYSNCGESYRLSYIEDIPGTPSGAAIAGKAMHQVIADAEASEAWRDEDNVTMRLAFDGYFTEAVMDAGGPDACRWGGRKDRDGRPAEDYRWWLQYAGDLFCRRYAATRRRDDAEGFVLYPEGVEMEVAIDIEGRHFVSYIDMLLVSPDGEPIIRDWKTGRMSEPYQLGVYAWVLQNSELALTVDRGQIGYLRGSDSSKYIQDYGIIGWRELVPRMLDDLIRGVEGDIFPLRPSSFCVSCDVRQACEYGVTLDE
jgi:hypothetical protein